jgi:hypothetical protein
VLVLQMQVNNVAVQDTLIRRTPWGVGRNRKDIVKRLKEKR